MKSSHRLTLGISSVVVATWVYLAYSNSGSEDAAQPQNSQPKVSNVVQTNQKSAWDILAGATAQADKALQDIPSERDQLIAFVENNLMLKSLTQKMKWYTDFLAWKYSATDIRQHIQDVIAIEEALKSDPNILRQMQYKAIWQKWYLTGEVPPHNILHGEIPAMQSIEMFRKQDPQVFSQIQSNPMFQRTVSGEETTFSEQRSIIEWMLTQQKIVQDNPNIQAKLAQYGYNADSVYAGNWQWGQPTWFFTINDAVYTLENPKNFDPEVWKQFQESDIWIWYTAGTIDPRDASRYINNLMIQAYP